MICIFSSGKKRVPAEISVPDRNSLLRIQPRVCGLNMDLGSNTCERHRRCLSWALQAVRHCPWEAEAFLSHSWEWLVGMRGRPWCVCFLS